MDDFHISGGIWQTSPIEEVPEIVLRSWQVMELRDGDRHFVGYNMTEGEGRVSSKIVTFDKDTMRGITASGRVYQLEGATGYNGDAGYVWNRWRAINKIAIDDYQDVSNSL